MLKTKRKTYILFAAEILCLLLLLPGCFKKSQLIHDFYGEDLRDMMTENEDYLEFCGEKITLLPGVYDIKIRTHLTTGQYLYTEMKADNAYYKSLLGNGVMVFAGNDDFEMSVYVRDKVSSAYVLCDFHGAGPESLLSLEVYRTNKGNRILLFLVLIIFTVLNFMLAFRRRILDGRIGKKQQVVFWALTAGVLLAYFPYLTDYFIIGADTLFQMTRMVGLADALAHGASLPIRIQSYWCFDHGYAVSLFYGDLFLFIPAALLLLGFPLMTAYKLFVFVLLAATAWIAYHSIFKCIRDEYAALFGALAYLLVPYHIFNVYNRGAIGECLAMAFLPLIFCGMYQLYTADITAADYKKYKWYLIWGLSAILQSHVISTVMTVIFMAVFCIGLWKKTFRRKTFMQLLQAAVISLLINMWFWLPLLYMMHADVYRLQTITAQPVQAYGTDIAAIFQLLPNKGGRQTGMWNSEPLQIGAGMLMLLVIYLLRILHRRRNAQNKTGKYAAGKVFALCTVVTMIMSTKYLPWDAIIRLPIAGYIVSSMQFPFRWMVAANLFAALFAACFYLEIKADGGPLLKGALGVAIMIMAGSAVYHVNSIAIESNAIFLYEPKNMGTVNMVYGEYLLEECGNAAGDMYYHAPVAENGLIWSDYTQSGTDITVYLNNETDRVLYVEMPLVGYKGYQILPAESAQESPYITEERGTHGDLRVAVPAGYQGNISISYKGFPIFHIAEAISGICLAAVLITYLYGKSKKGKYGTEIGRT